MKVLVIATLKEKQVYAKLAPIAALEFVHEIYLVRRYPLSDSNCLSEKLRCYSVPRLLRWNVVTSELFRIGTIISILARKRIDLVIGIYLVMHGLYAGLAAKFARVPVIQSIIGRDLFLALRSPWLMRFIRGADAVTTRGAHTKQLLVEHGVQSEKIYCPPNVFHFSNEESRKREQSHPRYDLIFVGALVKKKRVDLLLHAVAEVSKSFASLQLAVVGDGPERAKLEDLMHRLGLTGSVHFLGWREEVFPLLRQARVFVLCSEQEGLPMALIEAFACGLPAVVTDDADITTVAENRVNSLVIAKNDRDGLVRALSELLTDRELYQQLAHNAHRTFEERRADYSLESVTEEWREIITCPRGLP